LGVVTRGALRLRVTLLPLTGLVTVTTPVPTLTGTDRVILPATVVLTLKPPEPTKVVALKEEVVLPDQGVAAEPTAELEALSNPDAVIVPVVDVRLAGTKGMPVLKGVPVIDEFMAPGGTVWVMNGAPLAVILTSPVLALLLLAAEVSVAFAGSGTDPELVIAEEVAEALCHGTVASVPGAEAMPEPVLRAEPTSEEAAEPEPIMVAVVANVLFHGTGPPVADREAFPESV
jgi:hypothetical protein